jgi:hypothetical protein
VTQDSDGAPAPEKKRTWVDPTLEVLPLAMTDGPVPNFPDRDDGVTGVS